MKDPQKILRESWKGNTPPAPFQNPVKEGFWAGFRFVKLFWAVLLFGVIMWVLYTWGDDWGLIAARG